MLNLKHTTQRWGQAALLTGQLLWRLRSGRFYPAVVMDQWITVGPGSLGPVVLINGCTGMIFTIQTVRELNRFGVGEAAGGVFALAFCREMAPLLTAAIAAGQVGAAFAAELGTMRVTDQIDALQMLRTHPLDYLVLPRAIACVTMLPVLTVFAMVAGMGSGTAIAHLVYGQNPTLFLDSIRQFLTLTDLGAALIKAILFGLIIAIIGCSWGLSTEGGAKGVGQTATSAVVNSWIAIFIADFGLSLFFFSAIAL